MRPDFVDGDFALSIECGPDSRPQVANLEAARRCAQTFMFFYNHWESPFEQGGYDDDDERETKT